MVLIKFFQLKNYENHDKLCKMKQYIEERNKGNFTEDFRDQLTNSCRSCFVGRGSRRHTVGRVVVAVVVPGTRRCIAGTVDKLPYFGRRGRRFRAGVVVELLRVRPAILFRSKQSKTHKSFIIFTFAVAICFSIASASSIFPSDR